MALSIGVFPGDGIVPIVPEPVADDVNGIRYTIDVVREHTETQDVFRGAREVELVRPGGTVVNIGAGPQLPQNPYEGQVWILT